MINGNIKKTFPYYYGFINRDYILVINKHENIINQNRPTYKLN